MRRHLPLWAILAVSTLGYFAGGNAAIAGTQKRPVNLAATASGQAIIGRATVIDGDTIEVAGQRIRLNGIDAPESAQRCQNAAGKAYACGKKSANALDEFLAVSRPVTCTLVDRDQYGRFVGNCVRADGASVQKWLVKNGHALDWPRYSHGTFSGQEQAAKTSKLGVWQGDFQKPWDWRAARRKQSAPSATNLNVSTAGQPGCNIKANISRKGERIYHVPGQKYYEKTRISERKGERWFCSEAEARQAGWRRARN